MPISFKQSIEKNLGILFKTAIQKGKAFEFACSLLRVGGIEDEGWDEMNESLNTIALFDELANNAPENWSNTKKRAIQDRIWLFTYCHLIEMSAPYDLILNLLRLSEGKCYTIDPFNLAEKRKGKSVFNKQPIIYPAGKIHTIQTYDKNNIIAPSLLEIYDNDIRNAFFHSDFVISKKEFHIPSRPIDSVFKLKDIREKARKAFIFYNLIFSFWESYRKLYKNFKEQEYDFAKDYGEKLKYLVERGRLVGFEITRPNGTNSSYKRTKKGVTGFNIDFADDGGVGFFVGDLDALRKWRENQNRPKS